MPLTLEDRFAIDELIARYCFAIDHGEPEAYAACFTEDGEMYADGRLRGKGRAALAANIRKANEQGLHRRHWPCNAIIEGDANTARLRLYVMTFDIDKSLTPYLIGEYDDALVKVGGQWQFQRRSVNLSAGKLAV